MANLSLYFTGDETVTLERTAFTHPLLAQELRSIRGKTSGAYGGYTTFQWTPAVQSVVMLILRTAANYRVLPTPAASVVLEGMQGSPASSLDFSLGKLPNWLMDVFGVDRNGQALARRLFRRTNPERKRPGPVAISLNEHMLGAQEIKVFINSELIEDVQSLIDAADKIEYAFYAGRKHLEPLKDRKRAQRTLPICSTESLAAIVTSEVVPQVVAAKAAQCPCCGSVMNSEKVSQEAA